MICFKKNIFFMRVDPQSHILPLMRDESVKWVCIPYTEWTKHMMTLYRTNQTHEPMQDGLTTLPVETQGEFSP